MYVYICLNLRKHYSMVEGATWMMQRKNNPDGMEVGKH